MIRQTGCPHRNRERKRHGRDDVRACAMLGDADARLKAAAGSGAWARKIIVAACALTAIGGRCIAAEIRALGAEARWK